MSKYVCTENINSYAYKWDTHNPFSTAHRRVVSVVRLPRVSILPVNLFAYINLKWATWQNLCVCPHILRSQPNKYTCFNQPIHRVRSVASYVYEQHSRNLSSDSQVSQLRELAEALDASRELVVWRVPERGLCATCANCVYTNNISATSLCLRSEPKALASMNLCKENIQLLPTSVGNIHSSPAPTYSLVRLVSLPRASIVPENLL